MEAESAPLLNTENITAITTKLGGQIVCPKRFSLRSATGSGDVTDVTITSGSEMAAILDPTSYFLIFSKPLKITKINQKGTKINKTTRK